MDQVRVNLPAIHEIPCPSRNKAAASFSRPHTSATRPHQSLCAAKRHPGQMKMCTWLYNWMATRLEIFYLKMTINLKIPWNTKSQCLTSWAREYHSLSCTQKQQAEENFFPMGCWSKAPATANLVDIHNSQRKIPGQAVTYKWFI